MCEKPFTDFNFWGFKYHLICKIRLKLSTFFDFILSGVEKNRFMTHSNGLERLQQPNSPMGDGWPILAQ